MNNTNNETLTNHLQLMSGDMDDAQSMNFNYQPAHVDLLQLSSELVVEINTKRLTALQERKAIAAMNMVIANLYSCYEQWQFEGAAISHMPWLCYSRNRSKFSVPARYREAAHTYRRIIDSTIDPLLEAGCLYHVKGYLDRTRGVGK